ncbi:hypothetical protein [Rhodopseudomonas sp. BR0G17]|uniref:hypothetical protein n=1 Tax=Rhodopseudomonas sp. BR0G17 TaxID=2269368 RepID=UPI0013DF4872|nr:hypothetical protein [Rhodopseudomonas sp. BR0G17]NEW95461.1 hypothetical protein [Rhodopseudomonas sp. BR0G17]
MDFIFCDSASMDRQSLLQGDLLVRNERLRAALGDAHQYYADSSDYSHFLVLTQSCDLVRRSGRQPKSRYITLAAVRPVSIVVDRFLERHKFTYSFPIMLCKKERETVAREFLERLLHNTVDGFFLLKKDCHPLLDEDICAFLPLSVALRSAEHYEACLSAKIGQMDHIFAAKIGWLVGNLYSRVGTPDIEEHVANPQAYKEKFYDETLFQRTAWLSTGQFEQLREIVRYWSKLNPAIRINEEIAQEILTQLPSDQQLIIERVIALLHDANLLGSEAEARNVLLNDVYLQNALKNASA